VGHAVEDSGADAVGVLDADHHDGIDPQPAQHEIQFGVHEGAEPVLDDAVLARQRLEPGHDPAPRCARHAVGSVGQKTVQPGGLDVAAVRPVLPHHVEHGQTLGAEMLKHPANVRQHGHGPGHGHGCVGQGEVVLHVDDDQGCFHGRAPVQCSV
jgi:hypothetical protein